MNNWEQYSQKKIVSPEKLKEKVDTIRKAGKTIATLNGSFDLLHAGHLHILFEASKVAEVLIVALNSDRSVQQYKSIHRPIISLNYRLSMVSALEFVNYVTWFDETDPRNLLSIIKPDVHVNGAEYSDDCIEAETVNSFCGRIHLVSRIPGLSTSEIVEKIKKDN